VEVCRDDRASARLRSALALAVGAVAITLAPAAASAETIDFDNLSSGTTVNSQYSSKGVTFSSSPLVSPYGTGVAHSGANAIEEYCGECFMSVPLRVDFTAAQTQVGLWVGNGYNSQKDVRLTALDANGNSVGTADATLAPSSPAMTTHLEVTTGSPQIRAFRFGAVGDDNEVGLPVDDVEFSTAGPPPPCGATSAPTVILSNPTNNTHLQNNTVLLKGTVSPHGAPITGATVVSSGGTTRTAIAFPTPVDADGGDFAINMGGLLQPGDQKIFMTAENCAGTGASGNPIVNYTPLPNTAGFQQLAPVEVVQTVQSPFNPVPLIAGTANGTKRTIARVDLGATGAGPVGRSRSTRSTRSRCRPIRHSRERAPISAPPSTSSCRRSGSPRGDCTCSSSS
jgi:hypothetical protein